MNKQPDDLNTSDDLSPDVCPEGISQAMSALDYQGGQQEMEADATAYEELESEHLFGSIIGQLMAGFLKH